MSNEPVTTMKQNKHGEQNSSQPNSGKHNESALDEALKESFPASDPIAITIEKLRVIQPENREVKLSDELNGEFKYSIKFSKEYCSDEKHASQTLEVIEMN